MSKVVIIGGGQAGLSMSYSLQQRNIPHVLLEGNARIGDNWRQRWDSLSMFSPAKYDSMPGLKFPLPDHALPTKEQAADYLEQYAQHFDLPVRTGTPVSQVTREAGNFLVHTDEEVISAAAVIIASGPFRTPFVPEFGADLPEDLLQLHTFAYRNPSQLQEGPALVVGAGASGTQIALELSASRKVYIAGRDVGALPRRLLGKDIYWWLYTTGAFRIRWESWLGRKVLKHRNRGDALIGTTLKKVVAAGDLTHLEKVTGFENGAFTFAGGGQAPGIRNVVWATGYRPDYSWIELPVFGSDGWPRHQRGVVTEAPGLFFLGLKTLYRANSSTMGGVGEDAAYLAGQIKQMVLS